MNLLNLLQAASGTPPVEAEPEEVVVHAPPTQEVPVVRRNPVSADTIKNDEVIERKGMFGLKGGLRDIVGVLGDAFLTQAGRAPQYAPQRERERLGSALYGFTGNPQAAIERAVIDNPEAAVTLEGQRQQNLARQAQVEAQRAAISQKGYGLFGSLARTIKDPTTYEKAKPILARMAAQYGLDVDVPDVYDEGTVGSWVTRGITPDQGVDNDRADENAENQQEYRDGQLEVARSRAAETVRNNKERADIARSKTTAPRAAPNPTAASIAAPLLNKLANGGTLTPGQTQVLNRLGFNPNKGQGKGSTKRSIPALPPGFSIRKAN